MLKSLHTYWKETTEDLIPKNTELNVKLRDTCPPEILNDIEELVTKLVTKRRDTLTISKT